MRNPFHQYLARALIACISLGTGLLASCTNSAGPRHTSEDAGQKQVTLLSQKIRIERNGHTIIYRGKLTDEGLAALRERASDPAVTTLLVESSGGEIVAGMDFGNWMVDRALDVVVDHACLSSCANYIFTAARRKEILPGAVVAWHGSAKQAGLLDELDLAMEEEIESRNLSAADKQRALVQAKRANLRYLTSAINKQNEFFYRIGVDEYVTRVGNEKFGVRGFFYMSVDDMAAFGIDNVVAPDNYAGMEPRALARRIGFPVTLVRMN